MVVVDENVVEQQQQQQQQHTTPPVTTTGTNAAERKERRRKRRWGDVSGAPSSAAITEALPKPPLVSAPVVPDVKSKVLALQESVRARLAAAKQQQQQQHAALSIAQQSTTTQSGTIHVGGVASSSLGTWGAATADHQPPVQKRAKVYDLNLDVTGPTYQKSTEEIAAALRGSTTSKDAAITATTAVAPGHHKKQPISSNPYLQDYSSEIQQEEAELSSRGMLTQQEDERLAARTSKPRPRHKALNFVEPGKWQAIAERAREKAALATAAGFVSGRKTGHTVVSTGMAGIYGRDERILSAAFDDDSDITLLAPRADAHPDTKMPLCVEWWDLELLPSKLKKEVANTERSALVQQTKAALNQLDADTDGTKQKGAIKEEEMEDVQTPAPSALDAESHPPDKSAHDVVSDLRRRCAEQAALTYSKTAALVQHIVPVRPLVGAVDTSKKEPVLYLTLKERKRQRKLRRQEKQRELQDLQAAGLIPAPEPRLTLKNFIQVLGDQAFLDPSQMELRVQEQMQARQRAHLEKNAQNKLTAEQRAAKRARKLHEDTTTVRVAIFHVKDMSHPYHRAKVDLNAQQNQITGGVLSCPALSCIICEGGPKAIKRYIRLMLVRMKWTGGLDGDDEDDHEENENDEEYKTSKFNPDNKCELVWQGMTVKRLFKGFFFQACETADQCRKVLKAKGIAHYWDQVVQCASGRGAGLQLKLADDSSSDDEDEDAADSSSYRQSISIKQEDTDMPDQE